MKTALVVLVGMVLALGLAACGGAGSGGAEAFAATCQKVTFGGNTYYEAKHDFGTTDPTVLGRVSAIDAPAPGTPVGSLHDPGETSQLVGLVWFDGSVAVVACDASSDEVTFVLE
jgi:hypothetical protein